MKTLIEFKNFTDKLNQNNSRNYKIGVLKKYKDNDIVKRYLKFIFDPFIVTGISNKKLYKEVNISTNVFEKYSSVFELLDFIALNNTGSDFIIKTIQNFKDNLFELPKTLEESELLELLDIIITKDLVLGISSETINKVFGKNTIPTFNVQLANKYFEHPEVAEGKEFALTTKINGMRCITLKERGKVSFWSRQGQEIIGLIDLEEESLKYLPDNICLDGELVAISDNPDTYKKTMKLARTKSVGKHGLKVKVFDCMTAEEFKNQKCNLCYSERREQLNKIFSNYNFKYFELLPILYQGTDTAEITNLLNCSVANGEEGVMVNICNAPYEFKRNSNLLKCKLMQSYDLRIIGFEEGQDKHKHKGSLGAVVVKYKDGNFVRVGSGFSDKLRREIWDNQDKYLDKIIEVQYFEETNNQKEGLSLSFPVFKDFRDPIDKNTADF